MTRVVAIASWGSPSNLSRYVVGMNPLHLGFLEWSDPLSWTEKYSSKTKKAISEENRNFNRLLPTKGDLAPLQKAIEAYEIGTLDKFELCIPEEAPVISIHWTKSAKSYTWKWIGTATSYEADAIDICEYKGLMYVAYTIDSPTGNEDSNLLVRTRKSVWKYPRSGASSVAILNGRVYFIESESPLKSYKVISMSLEKGTDKRIEYVEKCHETILTLKVVDGGVFLLGTKGGLGSAWCFRPAGGVKRIDPEGVSFFPVGFSLDLEPVYFVRMGGLDTPWTLKNCSWKLSEEIRQDGIEFCSWKHGCLVSKNFGVRTLWQLSRNYPPKEIFKGIFSIVEEPCVHQEDSLSLWLISPGITPQHITITNGKVKIMERGSVYAITTVGKSLSVGDTLPVRWISLRSREGKGRPKGLMLIAYGSYGLPTSLDTSRWRLWLQKGWAVAILFVRGGGDGNDVWADLGRLGGKIQSVDDVEGCIRDLQRITGCGPNKTCLYGRSAGGTLVGNLIARHPDGELIGCAYTEVPYVDVLKTASNAALPLTEYEFHEFGNPRKGPADFEQVLRISPIHSLGPKGAPGVAVLCRTGAKDMQVFAYESLKWIVSLRGDGSRQRPKLLYTDSEGHISSDSKRYKEQAEDFAIVSSWISV